MFCFLVVEWGQGFNFNLSNFSEKEIEDVLCQHSKNAPCSHFLSGRCYPRSNRSNDAIRNANLGLLREACCLTSSSSSGTSSTVGARLQLQSRSNSQRREERVDLSGRNAVVTFDLRCANNRSQRTPAANNAIRPHIRSSILKREKSM